MPTDLDPLPGSADLVAEDAANVQADAVRLGVMQEQLATLRIDGSGYAVEGLQARIDEAALLVQEVFEHYASVQLALTEFAPELKQAQQAFNEALERRSQACSAEQSHEERRRAYVGYAEQMRANAVPEVAVGQAEREAGAAAAARDAARESIALAETDLDRARQRYEDAAQAAMDTLRELDNVCIDTGGFLNSMIGDLEDSPRVPSVLSTTGTAQQRTDDGRFDPAGFAASSAVFGATALGAGSTWVHNATRTTPSGAVRWNPTATWGYEQRGLLSPQAARSASGVFGSTGSQAVSSATTLGPRTATVVSRSVGVFGAAWTFYDVAAAGDTKYWYLAPEDRQAWATMEASAVTAGSVAVGSGAAAAGSLCGPLVVACAPTLGLVGGVAGMYGAGQAFDHSTYNERYALALDHFTAEHPGTSVRDGKIYFEGRAIGYFSIG